MACDLVTSIIIAVFAKEEELSLSTTTDLAPAPHFSCVPCSSFCLFCWLKERPTVEARVVMPGESGTRYSLWCSSASAAAGKILLW